jgi:hypothetical protein
MSRAPHDARTRRRATLASLGAAGLALLAPLLFFTAFDSSAAVSLAVLTLVLAALVRLADHGAVLADPIVGPPAAGQSPPVVMGRITDPVHHPLRPRAPGTA